MKSFIFTVLVTMSAHALAQTATDQNASNQTTAYVGTYSQGDSSSRGVYAISMDGSGLQGQPVLVAVLENASFVAMHPSRPLLYAVSEIGASGSESVGIVAFSIGKDGKLTKLNERSTRGGAACHVTVDPTGRCVGVANYTGGSCVLYPILEDGSLGKAGSFIQHVGNSGVNAGRQEAPHAHSINFNQDGTQAFVADLGKDQILLYDVDLGTGKMKPSKQAFLQMPSGGGPRHFSFHPDFDIAFSNLELTSQVALLHYDREKRTLTLGKVLDTIPDSAKGKGNSTAECLVHPSGKFLYVSNRGHNSIATFSVDAIAKTFRSLGNTSSEGEIPRGFGITNNGQWLVLGNQKTGNVVAMSIDQENGNLSPVGNKLSLDAAVNVRFDSK
ncbi:lactonase family protein [bacterium]|nr:lactonase family protein [bacterium]